MTKEYGNGNISVCVPKHELAELISRYGDARSALAQTLDELDVEFCGEPWSAGNFDIGYTLHNIRLGVKYTVYGEDIQKFQESGKIKLLAYKDSEE